MSHMLGFPSINITRFLKLTIPKDIPMSMAFQDIYV